MRERCPNARPVGVAYLQGYRLAFTFYSTGRWKGGCADIIGRELRHVWAYEVINKESHLPSEEYIDILLKAAHEFGFPKNYREYLESIKEMIVRDRRIGK